MKMFRSRRHRRAIRAVYGDILALWAMCRAQGGLPPEARRYFIREALHGYRTVEGLTR